VNPACKPIWDPSGLYLAKIPIGKTHIWGTNGGRREKYQVSTLAMFDTATCAF